MKSIIVDVDEKDLEELGITSGHVSLDELETQLLVRSIRKQRKELEKLNKEYGFNKLTEEEIFNEVNEATVRYPKKNKD